MQIEFVNRISYYSNTDTNVIFVWSVLGCKNDEEREENTEMIRISTTENKCWMNAFVNVFNATEILVIVLTNTSSTLNINSLRPSDAYMCQ